MSVGRNTIYNLSGAIIPVAVSLVTVPIYLKLIGIDRYGVLAIAWLVLGYFGLFDLGLGRAIIHRLAEQRDAPPATARATVYTALVVNLALGAVGGVLLAAGFALFFLTTMKVDAALRPELVYAAPLLGLSLPVATLTGVLTGALQGRERFAALNVISTLSTFVFQIAPLIVAWAFGPNLSLILFTALLTRGLTLLLLGRQCVREFGVGKLTYQRDEVRGLLSFGGWVTVTAFIAPFLTIIDRFWIGATLGATAVTFYTVPFQMAQRISIVPAALTSALFPRLSGTPTEEGRAALARTATRALSSIITLPVVAAVLLAEPLLQIWLGKSFADASHRTAELLLVACWFNALALVAFTNIQAKGRPELIAYILAAEVPTYILALYIGLTWFGLPGAAAALLLRNAMDYVLLSHFSSRHSIDMRTTLASSALFLAALTVTAMFEPWSRSWLVLGIALCLLALAEAWAYAPPALRNIVPWGRRPVVLE